MKNVGLGHPPPDGTDFAFFIEEKRHKILWGRLTIMSLVHNQLISLPEREERSRPGYWLLGGILVICFLFAGPESQRMTDDYQNDLYVTTWLSKEKARQLMRYHGTNGIMITADKVYIKRDGQWICVYRDPSILQDVETRPAVPTAKGEAASGNS
jgi:hypothetical protein